MVIPDNLFLIQVEKGKEKKLHLVSLHPLRSMRKEAGNSWGMRMCVPPFNTPWMCFAISFSLSFQIGKEE
jgi:hypothetical protein